MCAACVGLSARVDFAVHGYSSITVAFVDDVAPTDGLLCYICKYLALDSQAVSYTHLTLPTILLV